MQQGLHGPFKVPINFKAYITYVHDSIGIGWNCLIILKPSKW